MPLGTDGTAIKNKRVQSSGAKLIKQEKYYGVKLSNA